MNPSPAAFLEQLKLTFRAEAREHLQLIEHGLLTLERGCGPDEALRVLEGVLRAAHSLKGAARAVEASGIESACQTLEDILSRCKRDGTPLRALGLDPLFDLLREVAGLLDAEEAPKVLPAPPSAPSHRPEQPSPTLSAGGAEAVRRGPAAAADLTVRISTEMLDEHLLQAEEMLGVKLAAARRVTELRGLVGRLARGDDLGAELGGAAPVADVLQAPQGVAGRGTLVQGVEALARNAEHDRELVDRMVDDLLVRSKQLLLLPFATLAAGLPAQVRELCRAEGKLADLVVRDDAASLDKRILARLKDPLVHLLRNAVDHGIEPPDERVNRGKDRRGRIEVAVIQRPGAQVEITVVDDGCGIDVPALRAAAVQRGLASPEKVAAMDDTEALRLVFRPELSTRREVTRLSGRGLGMAIVHEHVSELGGRVEVRSSAGRGTTFVLTVPSVRATFRGVLVRAAGRPLVFPTPMVECVTRARGEEIRTIDGQGTFSWQGRILPVADLSEMLGWAGGPADARMASSGLPLVLVGRDDRAVAFAVQEVLEEREFLVKPLRPPLSQTHHVSSAAMLEDGSLALVLNPVELLESTHRPKRGSSFEPVTGPADPPPLRILVAEDSITSRMLIRNTLETAGYRVETAVDGLEALAKLRGQPFDLVVSDVEMPRLDGFQLTERIRSDARLSQLPVVLVTGREAPQDRERGVDAGASAYVVKSSFEQSTLLETVRRFL